MVTQQKTNRLINSTSPYLLQHAYNPVDWYEWGNEALEKARLEDKPILVSIGYSSCHWCHVMERETFENERIAEGMNEYFVCIKVDREERPDIDQIYMDAVQALGIQGGWPLNVFLTPEQKPFFGGTYFSPQSWIQVLNNIHKAFRNNRDQIEETAEELRLHLLRSDVERFKQSPAEAALIPDLEEAFGKLEPNFDTAWGGMDKAPKFVMPSVWLWLLRYHYLTKNDTALKQITLTLKRVGMGGIYDQIGGGFSRYSVDGHWFAPHFEKMLYDNAQLFSLYAEAYALTKDDEFKTILYESFDWLQREMTSDDGGFYSALDADSEGVEGKYYVWTKAELKKHLKKNTELLSSYYSVKEKGNWEHGYNILTRGKDDAAFLMEYGLTGKDWSETLKESKKILLRERNQRIRPGLDDKIIAAWNAMMIVGLADAYKAFGDTRFYKAAMLNMRFLENELMEGTVLYRSFKGKRSAIKGFLDDYAYVIQAQLKLYEITFDEYWINRASAFMHHVLEQFLDSKDGFFHYTAQKDEALIARKKEIFDNVIPSSNAVMARNLYHLGVILDRDDWKKMAHTMVFSLSHVIKSEPNYMSYWGIVYAEMSKGLNEVVIVGPEAETLLQKFHQHYHPFALVMGAKNTSHLPLVQDKTVIDHKTTLYVCYNKTCQLPVHTLEEAEQQLG